MKTAPTTAVSSTTVIVVGPSIIPPGGVDHAVQFAVTVTELLGITKVAAVALVESVIVTPGVVVVQPSKV